MGCYGGGDYYRESPFCARCFQIQLDSSRRTLHKEKDLLTVFGVEGHTHMDIARDLVGPLWIFPYLKDILLGVLMLLFCPLSSVMRFSHLPHTSAVVCTSVCMHVGNIGPHAFTT